MTTLKTFKQKIKALIEHFISVMNPSIIADINYKLRKLRNVYDHSKGINPITDEFIGELMDMISATYE